MHHWHLCLILSFSSICLLLLLFLASFAKEASLMRLPIWLSIAPTYPFSPNPCDPVSFQSDGSMDISGWIIVQAMKIGCSSGKDGALAGDKGRMKPAVGALSVIVSGWVLGTCSFIRPLGHRTLEAWNTWCCLLPVGWCPKGHRAAGLYTCKGKGTKGTFSQINKTSVSAAHWATPASVTLGN